MCFNIEGWEYSYEVSMCAYFSIGNWNIILEWCEFFDDLIREKKNNLSYNPILMLNWMTSTVNFFFGDDSINRQLTIICNCNTYWNSVCFQDPYQLLNIFREVPFWTIRSSTVENFFSAIAIDIQSRKNFAHDLIAAKEVLRS